MPDQPYIYFVSYSHASPTLGLGFGSQSIYYDRPVTSFADVEVLTQKVHERMTVNGRNSPLDSLVVLNFQLLSGPTTDVQSRSAEKALRDILTMVGQFDTPRDPGRVQAFVGDVRQVALRGLGHTR